MSEIKDIAVRVVMENNSALGAATWPVPFYWR